MASFKIGISGASPLRIQLTASDIIEVVHFMAAGENSSGTASRPTMSYPSTPGVGTGTILPLDGHSVSTSDGVTNFTSAPSVPLVNNISGNLPFRISTRVPRGHGFIIIPSSVGLYYAASGSGHLWTGSLEFEEY